MDGESSSITAVDDCQVSHNRGAKKILVGAVAAMTSFLTGRDAAAERGIQKQKGLDLGCTEETQVGGFSWEKNENLLWKK